jgi:hypothetical protein
MKFRILISIVLAGLSQSAFSEDAAPGQFAPVGYIGVNAHTLTMIEAHTVCLNEAGVGYTGADVTTASFESTYRLCMRDYTPFRSSGEGVGGDCPTQPVTWGQCAGVVNSGYQGLSSFVRNTTETDDYEGYANFMCVANNWVYLSGGCSRTADVCESGLVTQWGVTSPLWADIDPDTVYTDKYGQARHRPKANCAAEMERAFSGDYVQQKITSPETDFNRYYSKSNAPLRCFDGNWIREPIDGGNCIYTPKSCKAQAVSYNGCGFDIPALEHDEVYVDSTPNPYRSVGHAEAYCFDGELTVKSRSCQLSCESSFPARIWSPENGADTGQCNHSNFTSPLRMSPGSTRLIDNEDTGMAGNITYSCENGETSAVSSTCKPKPCEGIPSASWTGSDGSTCSHSNVVGFWEDEETVNKSSDNDKFVSSGSISYICENGSMQKTGSICERGNTVLPCISHEIELPPEDDTPSSVGGEEPPYGEPVYLDVCESMFGSDYVKVGGGCCQVNATSGGLRTCYSIP